MISVDNLTFDYPGTRALDGVAFALAPGSITALVGPNGAGKTTLLRCIAALERPVAGTVRVNGVDALADPRACHRHLGYLSDSFGLYDELTVRQCLWHAGAIRGLDRVQQAAAAQKSAQRLGIDDRLSQRAGTLSRGLRQRLAIAQAIVHSPQVLLLDEPASGLDPEARHALATLFVRLRDEGMTLLVSSHILAELEEYSTGMVVLRGGRVVDPTPLATTTPGQSELVTCTFQLARPVEGLEQKLAGIPELTRWTVADLAVRGWCSPEPAAQHQLLRVLLANELPVCNFAPGRRTLQDAYLSTVARSTTNSTSGDGAKP
jgi:ABC-2 type transport system ATP-binding protein